MNQKKSKPFSWMYPGHQHYYHRAAMRHHVLQAHNVYSAG